MILGFLPRWSTFQDLRRLRHAEYNALNQQLVEELPKLVTSIANVINVAVVVYATALEKYANDVDRVMQEELGRVC